MLTKRFVVLCILQLVFIFCNCKSSKTDGVRKLSFEEQLQKERKGDFIPDSLKVVGLHGEVITLKETVKYNRDSFALDVFVDRKGNYTFAKVRPITNQDILFRNDLQKLYDENFDLHIKRIKLITQDTAQQRFMIENTRFKLPIESIAIDCDRFIIQKKLAEVLETDQQRSQSININVDRKNLVYVVNLIEKCLSKNIDLLNNEDYNTVFLVLQHGTSRERKKYFPFLQELGKKGYIDQGQLALMEDRILTDSMQKQKYGSQVQWNENLKRFVPFPIEDSLNVDIRRLKIGLKPLNEYLDEFKKRF